MSLISIFLYEFRHFRRNTSKVISYLLFVFASLYAIYNGFDLQDKQRDTLHNIQQEQQEELLKVLNWFEDGKNGPTDRSWVDIHEPYWSLRYSPTYTFKSPSALLPLGIGQAEQYGYYKEITFWSSTYDNDMVEELANPERLVNGNIDFSFMVIYLLPVLLIILTYNIGGFEKDSRFEQLIAIQSGSIPKWLMTRYLFYTVLLLGTVVFLIFGVAMINNAFGLLLSNLGALLLLNIGYILFFAVIFYLVLLYGSGSSSIAFTMIGIWLMLSVIVPGSVHQYASMKYPVNYMTDYLDVNRKETYATYSLPSEILYERLLTIYPTITETKLGLESETNKAVINRSVSAIINQMNKTAVEQIEQTNDEKNDLIRGSYWFNPISYVQNQWNAYTSSDYYSYKNYRMNVQQAIDKKMKLFVFETWNKTNVDKTTYEQYIQKLK